MSKKGETPMQIRYAVNFTMESFFILVLGIILFLHLVYSKGRKAVQSDRYVTLALLVDIIGISFDIISYLFDEKPGTLAMFMNRLCMFISFAYGPFLLYFFARYTETSSEEWYRKGETAYDLEKENSAFILVVRSVSLVSMALLITTQFTLNTPEYGIYYFDGDNTYLRGDWYALFYFLMGILFLLVMTYAVRQRRKLKRKNYRGIIAASIIPVFGVLLQAFVEDIAFVNLSNALAVMMFFVEYEIQKSRQETAEREKMANMRNALMVSQIQPHFIFNALSTIVTLIREDPDTAVQAVEYFSDFMRGTMNAVNSETVVPISSELEATFGYLHIEKYRFGDSLSVETEQQDTSFHVPPLSIQPIVENAVKHGIRKGKGKGTVTIRTYETDYAHVVEVKDDGAGFDVNASFSDDRQHIGLSNVKERIRSLCGGSLNIESEEGKGTTVYLSFPKK